MKKIVSVITLALVVTAFSASMAFASGADALLDKVEKRANSGVRTVVTAQKDMAKEDYGLKAVTVNWKDIFAKRG